jgi:hypothetical protein
MRDTVTRKTEKLQQQRHKPKKERGEERGTVRGHHRESATMVNAAALGIGGYVSTVPAEAGTGQ